MPNKETWQAYRKEAAELRGYYLPDPDELQERISLLRHLQDLGLHRKLIDSIMMHNSPDLERVLQMVDRYGPEETWRRYEPFIEETE